MIEAKVKKRLGDFVLEAELSDEKFICLAGKNGSGKSTLLNILAGLLPPDEGQVKLNSKLITTFEPEKRNVVLVTPESYIPHLIVEKHLTWGAKVRGREVSGRHIALVRERLGITFDGRVSKLSLGMRERVALATALLSTPEMILVDEAFSNIDNRKDFIRNFRDLVADVRIDTIFATQDPEDSTLADHEYKLESGKSTKLF